MFFKIFCFFSIFLIYFIAIGTCSDKKTIDDDPFSPGGKKPEHSAQKEAHHDNNVIIEYLNHPRRDVASVMLEKTDQLLERLHQFIQTICETIVHIIVKIIKKIIDSLGMSDLVSSLLPPPLEERRRRDADVANIITKHFQSFSHYKDGKLATMSETTLPSTVVQLQRKRRQILDNLMTRTHNIASAFYDSGKYLMRALHHVNNDVEVKENDRNDNNLSPEFDM